MLFHSFQGVCLPLKVHIGCSQTAARRPSSESQIQQRVPGYQRRTLRNAGWTPAVSHPSPHRRHRHRQSRCCHLSGSCFWWFRMGPPTQLTHAVARTPPPRPPWESVRPRPLSQPQPPPLPFSLTMSSRHMSILSGMVGAIFAVFLFLIFFG